MRAYLIQLCDYLQEPQQLLAQSVDLAEQLESDFAADLEAHPEQEEHPATGFAFFLSLQPQLHAKLVPTATNNTSTIKLIIFFIFISNCKKF